jgi:hypothetical protein
MAFCAVFRIEFGFCFQVDAISNREKHKDQICPAVWWLEVRFELDLAKSDRSMEHRSHSSGHLSRWQGGKNIRWNTAFLKFFPVPSRYDHSGSVGTLGRQIVSHFGHRKNGNLPGFGEFPSFVFIYIAGTILAVVLFMFSSPFAARPIRPTIRIACRLAP